MGLLEIDGVFQVFGEPLLRVRRQDTESEPRKTDYQHKPIG